MKNFKETQRYNQWWLWVLFILISIVNGYSFYEKGFKLEFYSFSYLAVFVFAVMLFYVLKLKTDISKEGIKLNFIPFTKKNVEWKDVESVEVLNYGFVGGWGIRFWRKYGTVYNISGNIGLAIKLINGKKFLIGTQKRVELEKFIFDLKLDK